MKQPSMITVAKIGGNYSVDAKGAFGGGWTKAVDENELTGTIIRAWQMYGNNPLGCRIVGDLTPEAQEIADQLQGSKTKMVTVRMTEAEIMILNQAAEAEGESLNQWCRRVLLSEATKPHEVGFPVD